MLERVPLAELKRLAAAARLIAWVNWTGIDRMSEILERFLAEIAAGLGGPKRVVFFDLADPAKRSQAALQGALELIGAYQARFEVVLGMNCAEAGRIAPALGLAAPDEGASSALECAAALRASLGMLGQAGLGACVAAGLATAGRYIRTGLSPTLPELQAFVAETAKVP